MIEKTLSYFQKKSHQNLPELYKLLQHATQSWELLLSTSGGKLNPFKYIFYTIQWSFNSDGTVNIDYKSTFQIPIT